VGNAEVDDALLVWSRVGGLVGNAELDDASIGLSRV
jgi:hypothetical protein